MTSLISKVLAFADEYDMLPENSTILVCVSGGADSMCLLEVIRHVSYDRNLNLTVAHYNHKLRGEESDRDESFVLQVCEQHGIPFYSGRGDVSTFAKKNGLSIEEAARDMRYEFFFNTAERINADKICTAHTIDDNAETMLINFIRGAGAGGMSGIPPTRGNVVRPMLKVTKNEVMDFVTMRDIKYFEDSTNALIDFTRNNVRHNIVPLLKDINPKFLQSAGTAGYIFRADEDFISDIAEFFIKDRCSGLTSSVTDILNLPFAVSSRVIRKLYSLGIGNTIVSSHKNKLPSSLSFNHVLDVLDLCKSTDPSAKLSLPRMTVFREYDRLIFSANSDKKNSEFAPIFPIPGSSTIILGIGNSVGLKITCKNVVFNDNIIGKAVNTTFTSFLFRSIDICGKITVRPRREGDFIKLGNRGLTKTLKKLFIEEKIPARKRAFIPIISDNEGVLAIYGIATSDRAIPKLGENAIQIDFEEI